MFSNNYTLKYNIYYNAFVYRFVEKKKFQQYLSELMHLPMNWWQYKDSKLCKKKYELYNL